jgi:ABC-type sugar transport system ATPase subunit
MRGEIKHLQKRLAITSIFVTHDQTEAMTMADRIAVMNRGKLQAFDTPEDLYDRPKTLFIAGFIGNPPMNVLDVEVSTADDQFIAQNEFIKLTIPAARGEPAARVKKAKLGIRAEDIALVNGDGRESHIEGEVFIVEPLGRDDMLDIVVGGTHFYVLAEPEKRFRPGDRVNLHFDTSSVQFFDPQMEHSLLWQ